MKFMKNIMCLSVLAISGLTFAGSTVPSLERNLFADVYALFPSRSERIQAHIVSTIKHLYDATATAVGFVKEYGPPAVEHMSGETSRLVSTLKTTPVYSTALCALAVYYGWSPAKKLFVKTCNIVGDCVDFLRNKPANQK